MSDEHDKALNFAIACAIDRFSRECIDSKDFMVDPLGVVANTRDRWKDSLNTVGERQWTELANGHAAAHKPKKPRALPSYYPRLR
jgi:hypothetical protein